MYKIRKIFHSRDGRLDPDNREYGISQEDINELGDAKPYLGCATCIFAKIEGGNAEEVLFYTRDEEIQLAKKAKSESGWAEYTMSGGSVYKPEKGETGWWQARVNNYPTEIADGIGLPDAWHVSTFVIFTWEEEDSQVPDDGGPEIPGEENEDEGPIAVEIFLTRHGKNLGKYRGVVNKYE